MSTAITYNTGDMIADRYRIDGLLGDGGMGEVYRARDTLHDQNCALKVFRLDYLPSENDTRLHGDVRTPALTREQAAEQFKFEARLLANLDHPHLPRVTEYFAIGAEHFLVMTLIDGQDLAQLQAESGCQPFPENKVVRWAAQLLDALAYCHQRDVVHRDVKPSNVMVMSDGTAYLTDFGIAANLNDKKRLIQNAYTHGYSPWEQYSNQNGDSPTCDIYALGATLYTLLTAHEPPPSYDLFQGVVELRALNEAAPGVSPEIDEVVMRALSLQPEDRYKNAVEMRDALADAREQRITRLEAATAITRNELAITMQLSAVQAQSNMNETRQREIEDKEKSLAQLKASLEEKANALEQREKAIQAKEQQAAQNTEPQIAASPKKQGETSNPLITLTNELTYDSKVSRSLFSVDKKLKDPKDDSDIEFGFRIYPKSCGPEGYPNSMEIWIRKDTLYASYIFIGKSNKVVFRDTAWRSSRILPDTTGEPVRLNINDTTVEVRVVSVVFADNPRNKVSTADLYFANLQIRFGIV